MNYLKMKTHRCFPFGKYKGRVIHEIITIDSKYVNWVLKNTSFQLNDEEKEHLEEMEDFIQKQTPNCIHPGGEAACNPWEMWAYGGAISPYGSDFM